MKNLILALPLLFCSCVTSADLQRLTDVQARFETSVAATLSDQEKTTEEKLDDLKELNEERLDESKEVIDEVVARTEASLESFKGITGNPLLDLLGGLLITGVGTGMTVNRQRNSARKTRGEKV